MKTTLDYTIMWFEVVIVLFCILLDLYVHRKAEEYATLYCNNAEEEMWIKLKSRIILTATVFFITYFIHADADYYSIIYIFAPGLLGIHLVLFSNIELVWGLVTTAKGIYYCGLFSISYFQFYTKRGNLAELAFGFTLSLAILEGATALSDGFNRIRKEKCIDETKRVNMLGYIFVEKTDAGEIYEYYPEGDMLSPGQVILYEFHSGELLVGSKCDPERIYANYAIKGIDRSRDYGIVAWHRTKESK